MPSHAHITGPAAPLADRLNDARLQRDLTQKDVAAALGVHWNTVARWERGEIGIHRARVASIEAWIEGE